MSLRQHIRPFCASLSMFLLALAIEFGQDQADFPAFLLGMAVPLLLTFGCWDVVQNATSTDLTEVKKVVIFERWFAPSLMMAFFAILYQVIDGNKPPLWLWMVLLLTQIGLTLWFASPTKRERQYKIKLDARRHGDQFWLPYYERMRRHD
jgi:hypothetical protein